MPAEMSRSASSRFALCRSALLALALLSCGCLAPAIAPIHPMTAEAAELSGERELSGTLGYAAAPGAGLGDSSIPGTPYAEGEIRVAVATRVQLSFGAGFTFQHYFLPWLNELSLGSKLTLYDDPAFAFALAPRVVGASAFNVIGTSPNDNGQSRSVFGTRSLGFELPMLATHQFENGWALTLQIWARYHLLRQEDATVAQPAGADGPVITPEPLVSAGHVWGAGGALMFSFPKLRGSRTRYHAFIGVERLWLSQTSSSGGTVGQANPLVSLQRYSLAAGLGVTSPW
jgi:hypothetical protein